jgi:tripartite-type tricarboxylate transporter receptor subunit TctC
MLTKRDLLVGLTACSSGFGSQARSDELYPRRPIKLFVPFPPGTPSEAVVRIIADRLTAEFKQAVIIENRPGGAGGTVGAASVASAAPDGYTLLVSPPGPLVTAAALYKSIGYEPARFVPVALLFESPQLLAVHPAVSASSLQELAAHARSNPKTNSFASPGYGTQPHLLGEMFKAMAGIDIVHVPYRGPAAAQTDLLAGQVQMYFETSPLILPHLEAGKLRVLAAAGARRMAELPNVPTTAESGFSELVGGFWSGIVAPPRTPDTVVAMLNAAINSIMQTQEVRVALRKLGAEPRLGSPDAFARFLAEETRKWSAVINKAGLKID